MNEEQELKAVKSFNKKLDMIDSFLSKLDSELEDYNKELNHLNSKNCVDDDKEYGIFYINREIEITNYIKDLITEEQNDLMNALRSIK